MAFDNTSQTGNWFIPIDIVMISSTGLVIILASVLLVIIALDKTFRKVPMLLLCNSLVSETMFAIVMLSMVVISLRNDIKDIEYPDSLCAFRGYMSYALSAVRSHSYLLQSIYRYVTIVHPAKLYWKSYRFQIFLICATWIFSMIHPFPFLFTNRISYNGDNQVCHMPLQEYPFIFYTCFLAYLNPITLVMIIYFKLVRYIQGMNHVVTPVNQLSRAKRELQMVRRIVMLLIGLVMLGLPYTIFFVMSFVTQAPKYYFRIAFLFVDLSLVGVMIALFQFVDSWKIFVVKILKHFKSEPLQTRT